MSYTLEKGHESGANQTFRSLGGTEHAVGSLPNEALIHVLGPGTKRMNCTTSGATQTLGADPHVTRAADAFAGGDAKA